MPVNWMLDGQAHVYSVYKHTSFQVQGKKQNEIPDQDTGKKKTKKNEISFLLVTGLWLHLRSGHWFRFIFSGIETHVRLFNTATLHCCKKVWY